MVTGGTSVGGAAYTVVVTVAPQSQGLSSACFVHVAFPATPAAVTFALSAVMVAIGAMEVIFSAPLTGSTHEVMSGNSVEKSEIDVPAESSGAGRRGSVRSAETPTTTDMFASTRTRELRSLGLGFATSFSFSFSWRVSFFFSFLLLSSSAHWSLALVVSFASRRGKSRATVTRVLSLSLNSKPIGIVGVKATLSAMSASETLVVKGSALSVEPLIPVSAVLASSPSSTLMPAPSGIWIRLSDYCNL